MSVPGLPPADAAVWGGLAGFSVTPPVFLAVGYWLMQNPREALWVDNVTDVESRESFTGFAVAKKQAGGFLCAVLGVGYLCFAAVASGLSPVVLPALGVASGVVTAVSLRASDPRLEYVGIAGAVVAVAALSATALAVLAG